ncbi:MAG: NADH-ubiquinone oxidoreductase-F iron-sulfur binding region domain-containing protein [Acidimicrobiales bacterium]|nr:NADH-ubiquinone oxidoreductase-F iron-sulfur binding region domain-containing protein [Acidimicrobiales bacterium]
MPDLYFGAADEATAGERTAVAEAISGFGPVVIRESERLVHAGRSRTRERRHLLLPVLHSLQRASGWISPGGLDHACAELEVPPAEAYGVATFYHLFTHEPPTSADTVHVCDDVACRLFGSGKLIKDLRDNGHHVKASPCLGQCERGPAVLVQRTAGSDLTVTAVDGGSSTTTLAASEVAVAIDGANSTPSVTLSQAGSDQLRLLARVGVVDPSSLVDYRAHGGYEALAASLTMGPDRVIDEITAAGLSGRGGAAFPTGVKWRGVADQEGRPHHLVCNADESEPGTFKDRVVMEGDPFSVIEAMTVAGIAVGAEQGWLYIRGEYPVAAARLTHAISEAYAAGLLGADVASSGKRFEIHLRSGAGAYICGEETSLFNSIEGFRGEPRNKPPFPTTHGLFGEPTAINNVETLINVLPIVVMGGSAYAAAGTDRSPGTKLFCLSGRVVQPGTYEVEFGATLREIIDLAGGVPDGRELRAVMLGGAAGSFVGPESLDLPLTLEDTRAAGVSLGSGVIMVFDQDDDMVDSVRRIAEFFRDESCGQCVPCRVGTVRQEEVLVRLSSGSTIDEEQDLLQDLATVMKDASICGLGQTASGAVLSAIELGLLAGSKSGDGGSN